MERGMAAAALEGFGVPGDLILDPFGASPRLVREAALAGRAVLVASNNPVTRFVVRRVLQPFPPGTHTMEGPTGAEDRSRAVGFRRRELQHSLALEQLAPRGDPDREHAEAALSAYPDRAVYAIVTLLNKLEQLEPADREAAEALALSAMDQTNALVGHPERRPRPLQLTASPQFREFNLWRGAGRGGGGWGGGGGAGPGGAPGRGAV